MDMTGSAIFIEADKHSVVEFRILKQQLFSDKLGQHLPADTVLLDEIGKHPAHIGMGLRQNRGLSLLRFTAFAMLPIFHALLTAQSRLTASGKFRL